MLGDGDTAALKQFLSARDVSCPSCGYNLRGVVTHLCPECRYPIGLVLAPDSRLRVRTRRWLLVLAALAVLVGGLRAYQFVNDLVRWGMQSQLTPSFVLTSAGSLFFSFWLLTIGALGAFRVFLIRDNPGGVAVAATFTHRLLVYLGSQFAWTVVVTLILRLLLGMI